MGRVKGLRAHHIVIALGSLVCFSAMWMPLEAGWIPMTAAFWPVRIASAIYFAVAFMMVDQRRRIVFKVTRVLVVVAAMFSVFMCLGGLRINLQDWPSIFLPIAIPLVMLALCGRNERWFVATVAIITTTGASWIGGLQMAYGVAVFYVGALAMLVGAIMWTRQLNARPRVEIPEARVARS